jgi:hypothetical protein
MPSAIEAYHAKRTAVSDAGKAVVEHAAKLKTIASGMEYGSPPLLDIMRYPPEDVPTDRTRETEFVICQPLKEMPTADTIVTLLAALYRARKECRNAYDQLSDIEKQYVEAPNDPAGFSAQTLRVPKRDTQPA